MSYYDAMREVMDNAIDHDICNLYFYHVMMGLINKAESEHKFLYDEFMNAKGDRVKAENAKLREMVRDVGHLLFAIDADYCAACPRDSINHPCPVHTVGSGECLYKADIRELGIETDDV